MGTAMRIEKISASSSSCTVFGIVRRSLSAMGSSFSSRDRPKSPWTAFPAQVRYRWGSGSSRLSSSRMFWTNSLSLACDPAMTSAGSPGRKSVIRNVRIETMITTPTRASSLTTQRTSPTYFSR